MDDFVGQHDPLAVRIVLLDDGNLRIGIVVVDLTSISSGMVGSLKAILHATADVVPEHAVVCASHSFSTPHIFVGDEIPHDTDAQRNNEILKAFNAAMRSAATQAASTLQPARLGFESGTSPVGVNRDVPTPHGWWLGANDAGFADPTIGVLRVDSDNGKPLVILMNVAVQPSVMDGSQLAAGGKLISADLAGAAARRVEARYAGAVALFTVGAAGDQLPYLQANRHVVHDDGTVGRVDLHEGGFLLLELLGERLATDVIRVAESMRAETVPTLDIMHYAVSVNGLDYSPHNAPVGPVTSFRYQAGKDLDVPVVSIRIGDIAFVGVQPELAASIGAWIRIGSPYAHTLVATMVDGAAKYLPDAQSYDHFTYEARSSPYAQGAGERVATAIVNTLPQMHAK